MCYVIFLTDAHISLELHHFMRKRTLHKCGQHCDSRRTDSWLTVQHDRASMVNNKTQKLYSKVSQHVLCL